MIYNTAALKSDDTSSETSFVIVKLSERADTILINMYGLLLLIDEIDTILFASN